LPHSKVGKPGLAVFFKQDSIESYKTNRTKISTVKSKVNEANTTKLCTITVK